VERWVFRWKETVQRIFVLIKNVQFFIRDTSSSSGTFLNHIRLGNPGQTSRPFALRVRKLTFGVITICRSSLSACPTMQDGDILQLGVDYQGGHEEMYRCVKMKVEIGRQWGKTADKFKWVLTPFAVYNRC
jgi:pSer/pThr/pTyr-binding forkhead associated (FHA) protein